MFSRTTIASSMTMPTASVSASIVIELSVKPWYQIRPKVAMIDVGMAMAAMIVERQFQRNTSTTPAARIDPKIRCSSTLRMDALMNSDMSRTTRMSYPGGTSGFRSASFSFTASTTATVFVPDCRRTVTSTVGSPLRLAFVSASAIESSTVATSRS